MTPRDEQAPSPTQTTSSTLEEQQDQEKGRETPSSSSASDTDREEEEDEELEEQSNKAKRKKSRRASTSGSNSNGVTKRSAKKHEITAEEIRKYFDYSQSQAAHLLGISVSTLKRRFYAMGLGHKWPYPLSKHLRKKRSIAYIVHDKNVEDGKFIDTNTLNHLLKAFAQQPNSPHSSSGNGKPNGLSTGSSSSGHHQTGIIATTPSHTHHYALDHDRGRQTTPFYPPTPPQSHSQYPQQQYHHQPMYYYHQRPEHYY